MLDRVTIATVRFGGPTFTLRRLRALVAWEAQRRSRRALLRLEAAHLRDIGVTRAAARAEAMRSMLISD